MGLKDKKDKKSRRKKLKIIKKYWVRVVRVKVNNKIKIIINKIRIIQIHKMNIHQDQFLRMNKI